MSTTRPHSRPRPSPLLLPLLNHIRSPLHPLISITTGEPHPSFPPTLLHFHLLTEAQLDELAHHYHQRTPSKWSFLYPEPVVGRWGLASNSQAGSDDGAWSEATLIEGATSANVAAVEAKRRRFGRFVGLRGCESPTTSGQEAERLSGEQAMERYVRRRIEAGMELEREREERRQKMGIW